MKNTTIMFMIIILILAGGWFVFSGKNKMDSNAVLDNQQKLEGETQKIILSQSEYNYKDINALSGQPIEISADDSVYGCLRSVVFNINGKKYSKYLKTSNDFLELPTLSKGSYTFSCTMGMGFGKLVDK